jgi:Protein kinase domain
MGKMSVDLATTIGSKNGSKNGSTNEDKKTDSFSTNVNKTKQLSSAKDPTEDVNWRLALDSKSKMIGRGKQGCVFHPPLEYFGYRNPIYQSKESSFVNDMRYVMKVMTRATSRRERKIVPMLRKYDPDQKRFSYIKPGIECVLKSAQYNNMWSWDILNSPNSLHRNSGSYTSTKAAHHMDQMQSYYGKEHNSDISSPDKPIFTTPLSSAFRNLQIQPHSAPSQAVKLNEAKSNPDIHVERMMYKGKHKRFSLHRASPISENVDTHYGYISLYGGIPYGIRLQQVRKRKWISVALDMVKLLNNLKYLHDVVKVVHRDIKAANIGYTSKYIRFWDFGLAISIDESQTLESIYNAIDNIHFQIWSIDINAKCTTLRKFDEFWKWMHSTDVRKWCMWFDYCRTDQSFVGTLSSALPVASLSSSFAPSLNPSVSSSSSSAHSVAIATTTTAPVQTQTANIKIDKMEKIEKIEKEKGWYQEYITNCTTFWYSCESILKVKTKDISCEKKKENLDAQKEVNSNRIPDESKENKSVQIQSRYVQTIITMLKQNDILSLGLMFCDFIFNQYIEYHRQKTLPVPRPDLLVLWIQTVLIPMIHPNFKERISSQTALENTIKIVRLYHQKVKSNVSPHLTTTTTTTTVTTMTTTQTTYEPSRTSQSKSSYSLSLPSVESDSTLSSTNTNESSSSLTRKENEAIVLSPLYKKTKTASNSIPSTKNKTAIPFVPF